MPQRKFCVLGVGVCMCARTCIGVYKCLCVCNGVFVVCVCLRERERERERERDRERERERNNLRQLGPFNVGQKLRQSAKISKIMIKFEENYLIFATIRQKNQSNNYAIIVPLCS